MNADNTILAMDKNGKEGHRLPDKIREARCRDHVDGPLLSGSDLFQMCFRPPLSSSVNLGRTPDNVWQKEILQGGWQNKEWTRGMGKGKKRKGRIVPSIFEVEASFQRNEIRTQKYVYIYIYIWIEKDMDSNYESTCAQVLCYSWVTYLRRKRTYLMSEYIYIYMSDRIPDKSVR